MKLHNTTLGRHSIFLGVLWIALGAVVSGCFSSELTEPHRFVEEPLEIANGFFLGKEQGGYSVAMSQHVSENDNGNYTVIVSNANLLGWNPDFIVVETTSSVSDSTEWFVAVVSTRQVYHCATQFNELPKTAIVPDECSTAEEFLELKTRLGVPGNLVMRNAEDAYEQLKIG